MAVFRAWNPNFKGMVVDLNQQKHTKMLCLVTRFFYLGWSISIIYISSTYIYNVKLYFFKLYTSQLF